uniref:SSXT domain-containing protein n=1 Tax=Panagrellus redivivus TaxID=6233 RepID=A0A7E4V0M6_PANRE
MATSDIPEVHHEVVEKNYTVAKLLAENSQLVATISEYQKLGRVGDAAEYQAILHRNLMYMLKHIDPACLENVDNSCQGSGNTTPLVEAPTTALSSKEPSPIPCSSTDPIPSSLKRH